MIRRHHGLLAILCILSASVARADDWWNWRGPLQTGYSFEKDLPDTWAPGKPGANNLVWSAPYGCRSTPLVMNGKVYFINYASQKDAKGNDKAESIQERVMCLDADTGKFVWEYRFNVWHTDIVTVRLGWTNLAGDPATGNIYAHGTQGMFFCFDKNGKILWSHSLSEEYGRVSGYGGRLASPLVEGNLVIIGMNSSGWGDQAKGSTRFLAFDKDNGHVVWWSTVGGPPKDSYYSTPVAATINGVRLIISGGSDGGVYAVQASTGLPVWSYVFGTTAVNCSPVVDGNLVYIGQGEENPDNNIQGRVVCLDASQVEDGHPRLVWKKDGLKARYTSPVVHEGRLYITDDTGGLFCFDGAKGKQLWKFAYGRDSRGSPVLADGKIYIGEVNSKFHILKPGPKKCEELHEQFFASPDGIREVEINGSPAVANGRVYFATSEEMYCIGKPGVKGVKVDYPQHRWGKAGPVTQLQLVPADVVAHPGETVTFKVQGFDAMGNPAGEMTPTDWLLPTPPAPPGAKAGPPALKGTIDRVKLTVDAKVPSQGGYVVATIGKVQGKARVRVAPKLPYAQDFSKISNGGVPGGWVNTAGKFVVKTLANGEKVLAKVNDKASPLFSRGNAYIGEPTLHDYTIEADVMGGKVVGAKGEVTMPDMGIVANRYTLYLSGGIQKLRLNSWHALPRVDRTITFAWEPDTWYRLKLTAQVVNGKGVIKGKCWPRGKQEPAAWTIELNDPYPNDEGAPALYGYVQGIPPAGGSGTDIYYANVRITPNKKAAEASILEPGTPCDILLVSSPLRLTSHLWLTPRCRR